MQNPKANSLSLSVRSTSARNDLLLKALRGESLPRPPVWLMRQAGRTDPKYNALKEELGLPLEALFRHPEHAATISLLPQRLGVDAIIFFQDILTPLAPMGAEFVFRPGPVLDRPIRTPEDVERLTTYVVPDALGFVGETFFTIHERLDGALPVLGFAGAPWTLAVFLIEGGSFGREAPAALEFARTHPDALRALLERLTIITVDYLHYQIESGAAAVQLFESAAYLLNEAEYRALALPYQQQVFAAIRGQAPTINFARELDDLDLLDAAGADVISLPSTISMAEARARFGPDRVLQGNVSNRLVQEGPLDAIGAAVRRCVEEGGRRAHIFNLDHGLLKDTPFEHVKYVIRAAQSC